MHTPTSLTSPRPSAAARSPTRRAVFFDVENSSRPEHLERVVEHLGLASLERGTQLLAVGNFRVVGSETAHLLARLGARLVHSAPVSGVKDWSDLRIAVEAGLWLASSTAGDIVEIVTDDQAFDAVGDVAAGRGVTFRRLSYHSLSSGEHRIEPVTKKNGRRRHRRRSARRPPNRGGAP